MISQVKLNGLKYPDFPSLPQNCYQLSVKELKKRVDNLYHNCTKNHQLKFCRVSFDVKGNLTLGKEQEPMLVPIEGGVIPLTLGGLKIALDSIIEKYPAQINQKPCFAVFKNAQEAQIVEVKLPVGENLALTRILVNSKTGEIISDISNGV